MKTKRTRLSLLTLAMMGAQAFAGSHVDMQLENRQTIKFQQPSTDFRDAKNKIYEINRSNERIKFVAYIESFDKADLTLNGEDYTRITLPDAASDAKDGTPEIEAYRKLVEIPANTGLSVEYKQGGTYWTDTYQNILLNPQQPALPDVVDPTTGHQADKAMPFVKDDQSYLEAPDKKPLVEVEKIIKGGNKTIAVLKFNPMQYDPTTQELRIASQVYFDLVFHKTGSTDQNQTGKQEQTENNRPVAVTAQNADYLIVTPNQYVATLRPFVEWKKKLGYKVFVATLNNTGQTYDSIKRYIKNAYRAQNATKYVLLVGDHEHLPAQRISGHPFHDKETASGTHIWHTDFGYSLVNGDDNLPDVAVGRMPVDNADQLEMMLNRSIEYQRNPPRNGRFNHALLAGQFQDLKDYSDKWDGKAARMFMEDLHRVADFIGPDYNFFTSTQQNPDPYNKGYAVHTALYWEGGLMKPDGTYKDLKYGGWSYGSGRVQPPEKIPTIWKQQGAGNNRDISQAINNGVGFVLHRDHGYGNGTGWAHPQYVKSHTEGLANQTYPFVFSLNCATGWYDGLDDFAESWVLNENKGAVAYIGAARVSYSGYNDLFHVGIFDSFWNDYDRSWSSVVNEQSWRPAVAMNRAKERVFAHYGFSSSKAILTARLFNYLGDPELELRTKRPEELNVRFDNNLVRGEKTDFIVRVSRNGVPVNDATVTISMADNNFQSTSQLLRGSAAFVDITPEQDFKLAVNKHNGIPFFADVQVVEPTPPVTTTPTPKPKPPVVQPPTNPIQLPSQPPVQPPTHPTPSPIQPTPPTTNPGSPPGNGTPPAASTSIWFTLLMGITGILRRREKV